MKVIAVVPVKGASERIKNKNTTLLDGKPLFLHTLEKLLQIAEIDAVYLDTESDALAALANHLNYQRFHRSPSLATNQTDGNQLLLNFIEQTEGDLYLQILATSPFIQVETIRHAIAQLKSTPKYDSAFLVKHDKQYTWHDHQPDYDLNRIPNSKDLPDTTIETMGMYLIWRDAALRTRRRIGDQPYLIEASPLEAIDVNYPSEFALADLIAAGLREKNYQRIKNLTYRLSSPMISDVLDELGYPNQIIHGLQLNLGQQKLFGRAKTLKIKATTAQDTSSIYDALAMYQTVVSGDIIVVQNDLPHLAYFGELNANLARRAGAIGAIIGGFTRDSLEVEKLDFPVFSQGYCCKDIKSAGTVESINQRIQLQSVAIDYESLIFADRDGIVVIPKNIEAQVIQACIQVIEKESQILTDICTNKAETDIITRHGAF